MNEHRAGIERRSPFGLYRAVVVQVVGERVWVKVPRLGGDNVYGPLEQLASPGIPDALAAADIEATTDVGGGSGDPAFEVHHHDVVLRPLTVDDRVLVAFLEGRDSDIVVLGRLR